MPKQRSRRLRKKLHVGEFQEIGFQVLISLTPELTEEAGEAFVDALLDEVIEPRDLAYGGWSNGGYVCGFDKPSATESDREAIRNWLAGREEVTAASIGELEDAWYPSVQDRKA